MVGILVAIVIYFIIGAIGYLLLGIVYGRQIGKEVGSIKANIIADHIFELKCSKYMSTKYFIIWPYSLLRESFTWETCNMWLKDAADKGYI